EAVDHAVIFRSHGLWSMEQVSVGSSLHVVSQDFLTVEIDNDAVVALAAQFEAVVCFVSAEDVAKVRGVAVRLVFRFSNVHASECLTVTESSLRGTAVLACGPFGIVEVRKEE